ncbi:MAG: HEPN domain-containing protein [Thermoplasmata archaeon]|nr:MAG: HEPN domain-containing protein [Thermoplasmata archaeon]
MRVKDCFKEGLLKKTKPSKQYAKKSLDVSLVYIEDAKDNLQMNNNNLVILCSYTAMFHAARALLFRDGIKERSHLCTVSYLRETYPRLKRLANQLDSYRRNRHITLYGLDFLVSDDEARQAVKDAELFYKQIRNIIDEK